MVSGGHGEQGEQRRVDVACIQSMDALGFWIFLILQKKTKTKLFSKHWGQRSKTMDGLGCDGQEERDE